jgi:hypothetical protein
MTASRRESEETESVSKQAAEKNICTYESARNRQVGKDFTVLSFIIYKR